MGNEKYIMVEIKCETCKKILEIWKIPHDFIQFQQAKYCKDCNKITYFRLENEAWWNENRLRWEQSD